MPIFRIRADRNERGVLVQAATAGAALVRAALEHADDVGIVILRADDYAAESARPLPAPDPDAIRAAVRDLIAAYGYAQVSAAVREVEAAYEADAADAAAADADDQDDPEAEAEQQAEAEREAADEAEREAWDPEGDAP